jgi:hypothetical protein
VFDNKITFEAEEPFYSDIKTRPQPAKIFIPDWFKKLNNYMREGDSGSWTIKMCMPFLDSMSIGYILKMPHDYEINNMQLNPHYPDLPKGLWVKSVDFPPIGNGVTSREDNHDIGQVGGEEGGCPFVKQNSNQPFLKLMNPWLIKLPKGYSALFVPPINNEHPDFYPISGVVDCDIFPSQINFPIVLKTEKRILIKKGDPIVTVIPFKRESWKSEFKKVTKDNMLLKHWAIKSHLEKGYRLIWRAKKRWT